MENFIKKNNGLRKIIFAVIVFCVLFVLAYYAFLFFTKNTENKLKNELLDFARVIGATIDPQDINSLTGTAADLENPQYLDLKNRMIKVGNINQAVRYIYIISQDESGNLFFHLDSQPSRFENLEGAEPTATPGEIYIDESGDFSATLNERKEIVSEPYTDKWGTFISVSVPIIDVNQNKVIALLGVDTNLNDFNSKIENTQILVFVISAFVLLLVFFLFFYLFSQQIYKNKIKTEKEKVQKFLDLTPSLIIGLDSSGKVIMVNQFGCNFLSGDRSEIIGKNWINDFIPENLRENIKLLLKDIFDENVPLGEPKPIENDIVTLKGDRRTVLWNYNVVYENGRINQIIASGQDVTSKRAIEEKLIKNNQELEKLNKLMVGREIEMINLKKEISKLKDNNVEI
ncbi:MAG TPA: PAS domain S-box protein [Candidatus Paceibacterota bacterium]|nr:PAS domain S-box protein [Candidatus Paceibacterota bacterium]